MPHKKKEMKKLDNREAEFVTDSGKWIFELYIAGMNPRAVTTMSNLKHFCKQFVTNEYEIILIDLLNRPQIAYEKQIFAIPTLIKTTPAPVCRSIGDLSNFDDLLIQLNIEIKAA